MIRFIRVWYSRRPLLAWLIAVALTATVFVGGMEYSSRAAPATESAPKLTPNDWLLGAKDDTERFRRLQQYLRGFDQPMWEVGERYRVMYDALKLGNYELARYHWKKIKTTIENGVLKRPERGINADAMLFGSGIWEEVDKSFASGNSAKAWEGFTLARETCMGCHMAEPANGSTAEFINNQPLFRETLPPKIK